MADVKLTKLLDQQSKVTSQMKDQKRDLELAKKGWDKVFSIESILYSGGIHTAELSQQEHTNFLEQGIKDRIGTNQKHGDDFPINHEWGYVVLNSNKIVSAQTGYGIIYPGGVCVDVQLYHKGSNQNDEPDVGGGE